MKAKCLIFLFNLSQEPSVPHYVVVPFHINSQNKQASQMFKNTLKAKYPGFLNDCHIKFWYPSFIYAVYFRFPMQPTQPQGAVCLMFLRTPKRQHKYCAFTTEAVISFLLYNLIEKPRILA